MAAIVTQIRFGDYRIKRDTDGVTFWLHAVNASCTGWSIRVLTPGIAQPGQHLFQGVTRERALEIVQRACTNAMTLQQVRELEQCQRDALLAREIE